MDEQELRRFRLGLLTELVTRAAVKLGRTTVMKRAYFLQTSRLNDTFAMHTLRCTFAISTPNARSLRQQQAAQPSG
jgi:hypothetical protein